LQSKIIIALDFPKAELALAFAEKLDPTLCKLKIGLEMYTAFGQSLVKQLMTMGFDIFLDLKFHDIPNTVGAACAKAAELGVWMTNVHALGGLAMMQAAKKAVEGSPIFLTAVTILTSHHADDLQQIGIQRALLDQIQVLTQLAIQAELHGIVCSAQEVKELGKRLHLPAPFLFITPGIRPVWSKTNDQQRIVTPAQAQANGAQYLVIGRPITRASQPQQALNTILSELAKL